jgi:hypothetical protein
MTQRHSAFHQGPQQGPTDSPSTMCFMHSHPSNMAIGQQPTATNRLIPKQGERMLTHRVPMIDLFFERYTLLIDEYRQPNRQ